MGNTHTCNKNHHFTAVHPHTSGEYFFDCKSEKPGFGSSPHKWGIRPGCGGDESLYRFIPTQVGNTVSMRSMYCRLSVHPHTSGEYGVKFTLSPSVRGSSPHKWGIRRHPHDWNPQFRFIPTQVGNTDFGSFAPRPVTVHPHTSGEYSFIALVMPYCSGSSPHKWGILICNRQFLPIVRFIPTQVGNTDGVFNSDEVRAVHPHTSGEYLMVAI